MCIEQEKGFTIVTTDRFAKPTRAVAVAKLTTAHVAAAVLQNCVVLSGVPDTILTDNGKQFTSEFVASLCRSMGTSFGTTTEYLPQTNGQVQRYNRTSVARLRHYMEKLQRDLDLFVQQLSYANNRQVHRTTETNPFNLTSSCVPPGSLTMS